MVRNRLVWWVALVVGCGGPALTPAESAAVSYKAQQDGCVDKYSDRAGIDACRDDVKRAWLTKDAGSDGAK